MLVNNGGGSWKQGSRNKLHIMRGLVLISNLIRVAKTIKRREIKAVEEKSITEQCACC